MPAKVVALYSWGVIYSTFSLIYFILVSFHKSWQICKWSILDVNAKD